MVVFTGIDLRERDNYAKVILALIWYNEFRWLNNSVEVLLKGTILQKPHTWLPTKFEEQVLSRDSFLISVKFMHAINQGQYILSLDWIGDSYDVKAFLGNNRPVN